MTESIIASGDARPIPPERVPAPFFALNAKYLIDPKADLDDLGEDIGLLCASLVATLTASTDGALHEDVSSSLSHAALSLAEQVSSVAYQYVTRTMRLMSGRAAPAEAPEAVADKFAEMADAINERQALSDADCANNAVRQALDAIQVAVYSDLGPVEQGLYEAAIASTERLERALSRGLDARSEQ